MFDKLKKHGVKILVFFLNIILAAIAVFVIREKDQARLLENAQTEKGNFKNDGAKAENSSSFENSVVIEKPENSNNPENSSEQTDPPIQTPPAEKNTVVPVAPAKTVPADPIPAPAKKTKPSDAKTKTS